MAQRKILRVADKEHRNTIKMKAMFSNSSSIATQDKRPRSKALVLRSEKRAIQTTSNALKGTNKASKKALKIQEKAFQRAIFTARNTGQLVEHAGPRFTASDEGLQCPLGGLYVVESNTKKAKIIVQAQVKEAGLVNKKVDTNGKNYHKIGKRGLSRIR